MQTSPLPFALRATAGFALAPPIVTTLAIAGAAAQHGAVVIGHAMPDLARAWLLDGYFVEIAVFLPLYLLARRYADMSCPARLAALGAYAAWTAPVAYMLLLTVWRGGFFDVFVIEASDFLLSPANATLGALGGLMFWLVAAAPAPILLRDWPAPRLMPHRALAARRFVNGEA